MRDFRSQAVPGTVTPGNAAGTAVGDAAAGAIQLASAATDALSKEAVSQANGGAAPVNDKDLRTDAASATAKGHKNLFYIEKFNKATGEFDSAHKDMQLNAAVAGKSGGFKNNLTGDYLIHAAIPAKGDCSFLLINAVSANGNTAFSAYSLEADGKSYIKMA